MSEQDIIEEIKSTNWEAFKGPEYYESDRVVTALLRLVHLRREEDKWNIYNQVLFAVGNNHAGTYYPAILTALPLLTELLKTSQHEIVRNCIYEILSELYYSFGPELGTYSQSTEQEIEKFVRMTIKSLVVGQKWNESNRNELLITDLINYFNEEAST